MRAIDRPEDLEKSRIGIARQVRDLRTERRWTQAELARRLAVTQGRLSELERGNGSFSAEQFLLLLRLFNVGASHFETRPRDDASVIQNALARLGALHLQESADVLPSDRIADVATAVRETLAEASPRLITALAPVLVSNIDRINLKKLHAKLVEAGLGRRLGWLVENTLHAVRRELLQSPPRPRAQRLRRAEVVLGTFLEFIRPDAGPGSLVEASIPDILDAEIRSLQTVENVKAASSTISQRWGIVTRLLPEDFARALGAARAAR